MKNSRIRFIHRSVMSLGLLACALGTVPAHAITALKKVQATDGTQIDLFFDEKVGAGQVKTEFINDIIQLSLNDVSVYPAKIFSVSGMDLTKVFAYQYSPKLVRCRLTVKGKAESYKDRVQLKFGGKVLSVRLIEGGGAPTEARNSAPVTDTLVHTAAQAAAPRESSKANSGSNLGEDEKKILERVVANEPIKPAKKDEASGDRKASPELASHEQASAAHRPLAGGKPLPSPLRSFGMLGLVLALFFGAMVVLKKLKGQPAMANLGGKRSMKGKLGKFVRSSLGGKGKMIEVVATHYLGPKKSIAVVKIGGQTLVLGVSNDSINLITQMADGGDVKNSLEASLGDILGEEGEEPNLPGDPKLDLEALFTSKPLVTKPTGTGAVAAGRPQPTVGKNAFSDILNSEAGKPSIADRSHSSVRAQIRSRIEGMKQL